MNAFRPSQGSTVALTKKWRTIFDGPELGMPAKKLQILSLDDLGEGVKPNPIENKPLQGIASQVLACLFAAIVQQLDRWF